METFEFEFVYQNYLSAFLSLCPPSHPVMCSFTVFLKPIQESSAFEMGSPIFGKLFPLCDSTDIWYGWKQLQGKNM